MREVTPVASIVNVVPSATYNGPLPLLMLSEPAPVTVSVEVCCTNTAAGVADAVRVADAGRLTSSVVVVVLMSVDTVVISVRDQYSILSQAELDVESVSKTAINFISAFAKFLELSLYNPPKRIPCVTFSYPSDNPVFL